MAKLKLNFITIVKFQFKFSVRFIFKLIKLQNIQNILVYVSKATYSETVTQITLN